MNILLCFSMLVLSLFIIYFSMRTLGKSGLSLTFLAMSFLSFLLSFKHITLSSLNITANAITSISMFTCLYLIYDTNQTKETKSLINLNFFLNILTSLLIYLTTIHQNSLTDSVSINMQNVFLNNYRLLITYPLITLLANYLLLWTYQKIKHLYTLPFITTVTTFLFVGLIEGIIYNVASYLNILTPKVIIELILSTYMVKLIITIIYSLFLNIISKKKVSS